MIGQTYEKLGEEGKAIEFDRKASTTIAHNPPLRMRSPSLMKKLASVSN
jgi:hypothetical protein